MLLAHGLQAPGNTVVFPTFSTQPLGLHPHSSSPSARCCVHCFITARYACLRLPCKCAPMPGLCFNGVLCWRGGGLGPKILCPRNGPTKLVRE